MKEVVLLMCAYSIVAIYACSVHDCVCVCTLFSLDCGWRGDPVFSPEVSITIHYYSALHVCSMLPDHRGLSAGSISTWQTSRSGL